MMRRYQLLVEGKDDLHVFYNLLEHHHIPERFIIKSQEGFTKLQDTLRVQLKPSDEDIPIDRLGIVVDADTDIAARWQSLRTILANADYAHIPDIPDPGGTIIEQEGRPIIGIWLMPNNLNTGMLEDFVSLLIPPGDLLWPRATQCVQAIPPDQRRFIADHTIKAHIHTWLAWQEEPGEPLGLSIKKRYFDANAPYAQLLISWIRRLFALGAD